MPVCLTKSHYMEKYTKYNLIVPKKPNINIKPVRNRRAFQALLRVR